VAEGKDRGGDDHRRRRKAKGRTRRDANASSKGERAGDGAAEPEAEGAQGIRDEERREGEGKLQSEPDQEGGLGHQVVRNSTGRGEPLEMLLDREAQRRQEREQRPRGARWSPAPKPLADAQQQAGEDEREPPDHDRRGIAEVRVAAVAVEAEVVLRAGGGRPGRRGNARRATRRRPAATRSATLTGVSSWHCVHRTRGAQRGHPRGARRGRLSCSVPAALATTSARVLSARGRRCGESVVRWQPSRNSRRRASR
jgi:hypothetical protein